MVQISRPTKINACILLLLVSATLAFCGVIRNDTHKDPFYNCYLNFLPIPEEAIKFDIHLVSSNTIDDFVSNEGRAINETTSSFRQLQRDSIHEDLRSLPLDLRKPFIFLINGFNFFGNINDTWMYQVGQVFVGAKTNRVNVIVFTWQIPQLFTTNMLAMIPAYYRTVANYDTIVKFVTRVVQQIVVYVDKSRKWKSETERLDYYKRFEFYGHSLGSHIMSDSVIRTRESMPELQFGKFVGLDPAVPCFLDGAHGLSSLHLSGTTGEVVVIHSNAGFAGVTSDRGQTEIVLNGGTFQPGCSYFDFECSHTRSTDVFSYRDDQCQMVAYKCINYEQFKIGACETCDRYSILDAHRLENSTTFGCKLVNFPEQHIDDMTILNAPKIKQRKVKKRKIDYRIERNLDTMYKELNNLTDFNESNGKLQKMSYYYVKTNPNYKNDAGSHCLQHYQARLLTLNNNLDNQQKCPLNSYLSYDDNLALRFIYDIDANGVSSTSKRAHQIFNHDRQFKPWKKFTNTIPDILYTGLLNYWGKPRAFVGATIDNIDTKAWTKCLINQQATNSTLNLFLDIAFMSHIQQEIRHAYSSVLCGTLKPGESIEGGLVLNLCKQSELMSVSNHIDDLLHMLKFKNQFESWKISLLNSLFSFFVGWEPF